MQQATCMPILHSTLERHAIRHLNTKRPMCIWSPPGCGKTDHIRQIAANAGYDVIDWRLAQMDAVDVRGIPYRGEDNRTHYAPPASLPADDCGPTLLFLDEIMQAHSSVSAVAGQLIHERRLGDYHLPDNVVVFAASNRHFDRAAATRMAAHTANRFLHYELEIRPTEWCDWATANRVDDRIIGVIRWRPELVYQYDPKEIEPAYPSLRSWTNLSDLIDGETDTIMLHSFSCAAVGRATGSEFTGYVKALRQLPDLDEIIADPDAYDDPEQPDLRNGVTAGLARRADENNIEAIWRYMIKLADDWQVLFAKDVMALGYFDLTQTEVYNEIVSLHAEALTA